MRMILKNLQILGWIIGTAAGLVIVNAVIQTRSQGRDSGPPVSILPYYETAWKNPRDTAALSLNFSPYYLPGADPELQSPVSEEAIRNALDAIVPFTDTIRTFGVSGELFKLYKIAKGEYGLRVIAGCWIGAGYSEEQVREELALLADIGNQNLADILVVGSEGLHRRDYSAESLMGWVSFLKGELTKDIPVGTSDTAGMLLGNSSVLQAVDVVLFTYYPYFNGVSVKDAVSDFDRTYRRLQEAFKHTKFICSETGYKFSGRAVGSAIPSPEAAALYFNDIIAYSQKENLEICYFEAIEEDWKNKYDDAGWGLLDKNLKPLPSVREALNRIKNSSKIRRTIYHPGIGKYLNL